MWTRWWVMLSVRLHPELVVMLLKRKAVSMKRRKTVLMRRRMDGGRLL